MTAPAPPTPPPSSPPSVPISPISGGVNNDDAQDDTVPASSPPIAPGTGAGDQTGNALPTDSPSGIPGSQLAQSPTYPTAGGLSTTVPVQQGTTSTPPSPATGPNFPPQTQGSVTQVPTQRPTTPVKNVNLAQPAAPPSSPSPPSVDDTAARFSSRDSSVSGGSQSQKPAGTDEPQTGQPSPPSPAVGIEQRAPVDAPQPIMSTSSEVDTSVDPKSLSAKRFPDDLSSTWRRTKCLNCGYVHEGEAQMTKCPKCGNSDPDKFGEAE